jgi:protease I
MTDLTHAHVLMLATDGFEQDELFKPRQALLDAGAKVTLASPKLDPITGEKGGEKGESITPDTTIDQVDTADYDALVLPGGVVNPDRLRMNPRAVEIVREFVAGDRIVAAICHAPWLLVEADVVEEVVIDGKLITSRQPADIPAFNRAVIDCLSKVRARAAA